MQSELLLQSPLTSKTKNWYVLYIPLCPMKATLDRWNIWKPYLTPISCFCGRCYPNPQRQALPAPRGVLAAAPPSMAPPSLPGRAGWKILRSGSVGSFGGKKPINILKFWWFTVIFRKLPCRCISEMKNACKRITILQLKALVYPHISGRQVSWLTDFQLPIGFEGRTNMASCEIHAETYMDNPKGSCRCIYIYFIFYILN